MIAVTVIGRSWSNQFVRFRSIFRINTLISSRKLYVHGIFLQIYQLDREEFLSS